MKAKAIVKICICGTIALVLASVLVSLLAIPRVLDWKIGDLSLHWIDDHGSDEGYTVGEASVSGEVRELDVSWLSGSVTVELTDTAFPTREYDGFTLPAGTYLALRVVIGAGEGHNWWCIVFPPVCLSAVQSEQVEEAMSVEDYALITRQDGYELRFRTVELWGELLEKLEENGWIAAGDE